ncbi:hypothetical protein MRX96_003477 [Rhipicephalus microplus]
MAAAVAAVFPGSSCRRRKVWIPGLAPATVLHYSDVRQSSWLSVVGMETVIEKLADLGSLAWVTLRGSLRRRSGAFAGWPEAFRTLPCSCRVWSVA